MALSSRLVTGGLGLSATELDWEPFFFLGSVMSCQRHARAYESGHEHTIVDAAVHPVARLLQHGHCAFDSECILLSAFSRLGARMLDGR